MVELSLHDAPWHQQKGDILAIRYAAGGSVPACGTYEVVEDEDELLILVLRSHTFPEPFATSAGAYAQECLIDAPFFEP